MTAYNFELVRSRSVESVLQISILVDTQAFKGFGQNYLVIQITYARDLARVKTGYCF